MCSILSKIVLLTVHLHDKEHMMVRDISNRKEGKANREHSTKHGTKSYRWSLGIVNNYAECLW